MKAFKSLTAVSLLTLIFAFATTGCAKVGSERWCAKMKEKPKKEWTAEEASDYAKHCVFE